MQATALAFHPAFLPFIPPSSCGMPALEVHSGSWIPIRITAVQGCSESFRGVLSVGSLSAQYEIIV